jgi:hypothetical protein
MAEVQVKRVHNGTRYLFTAGWDDSTEGGAGSRSVELYGRGATEVEARAQLLDQTKAMRDRLNSAIEQMIDEQIRPPRVPV